MDDHDSTSSRRDFLRQTGAVAASAWSLAQGLGCEREEAKQPADQIAGEPALASTEELLDSSVFDAPPAVFRPASERFTLHWNTEKKMEATLLLGNDPKIMQTRAIELITPGSTIALNNIPTFSKVYWQLQLKDHETKQSLQSALHSVQTGRKPGEVFRVAFLADSHLYSSINKPAHMENLRKTVRRIILDQPDFVVFLGDEAGVHFLADKPRQRSQQLALDRWRTWRREMRELLIAIPSVMVLGNHEGEAGYYQTLTENGASAYLQRWGTIARKQYFLNPLPDSNPEGGENESAPIDQKSEATSGFAEGNGSPLQNYFAWTWGDCLFVALDVHRYTRVGLSTPDNVNQWTLGAAQMRWFEQVLEKSGAKWKCVIAHHLVGASKWDLSGRNPQSDYVYGRGGGRYARVGEQSKITDLMIKHGAQFFLYGHDHVFAHQPAEGLHFVCCGRPTYLQPDWWKTPGWKEAYGETARRNPHDFYGAIGYTLLEIAPAQASVRYIRTGTDRDQAENIDSPEGQTVYEYELKI